MDPLKPHPKITTSAPPSPSTSTSTNTANEEDTFTLLQCHDAIISEVYRLYNHILLDNNNEDAGRPSLFASILVLVGEQNGTPILHDQQLQTEGEATQQQQHEEEEADQHQPHHVTPIASSSSASTSSDNQQNVTTTTTTAHSNNNNASQPQQQQNQRHLDACKLPRLSAICPVVCRLHRHSGVHTVPPIPQVVNVIAESYKQLRRALRVFLYHHWAQQQQQQQQQQRNGSSRNNHNNNTNNNIAAIGISESVGRAFVLEALERLLAAVSDLLFDTVRLEQHSVANI